MRLYTIILFFVLGSSNLSFAQVQYAAFEWEVLSWIRQSRLGLLTDIETYEYNKKTYGSNCSCVIDGAKMRNRLDSLIQEAKSNFVKHIYTEMNAVVQEKNMPCYDLLPLWNNKLKELENLFLDVKSQKENEEGYVSTKDLKEFCLTMGEGFRIKMLNLYPYDKNTSTCLECLGNRWFQLLDQHLIKDPTQQTSWCYDFSRPSVYNEEISYGLKNKHLIKNATQLVNYYHNWVKHMSKLVNPYVDIIDDSRKNTLNEIKISIPLLKQNTLNHSQQSTLVFVQQIYKRLHDALPNTDVIGKIDLLELWMKTILNIRNEFVLDIEKNHGKTLISNKELKKIKHIRNLYDLLDVETSSKAKEDHEIKSVFLYLIEKSLL